MVGVAAAVALVLVASAGAWAVVRVWFSSGAQPEEAMPASVGAYARLDLDPSLDQGTKLVKLLRKFPKLTESTGTEVTDLERRAS
jgi:hypothetical protein